MVANNALYNALRPQITNSYKGQSGLSSGQVQGHPEYVILPTFERQNSPGALCP